MTTDDTNPLPDPAGPPPSGGLPPFPPPPADGAGEPAQGTPPPAPAAPPPHPSQPPYAPAAEGPWGAAPPPPPVAPPPTAPAAGAGAGWKRWAATGAGAAVILAAGVVGLKASGSDAATADPAVGGPGSGPGNGQFPGQDDSDQDASGRTPGMPGDRQGHPDGMPGAFGTVASVGDDGFTVESTDGSTVDVAVDGDTRITEAVEGSLDDLAEGDTVLVHAHDGWAERIVVTGDAVDAATGPGPMSEAGTVVAVGDGTLAYETADGDTVEVGVDDETSVTTERELSLDDLSEGDTVMVQGTADGATVTAAAVHVGDVAFGPGPGGGRPGQGLPGSGQDDVTGAVPGMPGGPGTDTGSGPS